MSVKSQAEAAAKAEFDRLKAAADQTKAEENDKSPAQVHADYEAMKARNAAKQAEGISELEERARRGYADAQAKAAQAGARRPNQLLQFFTYGHLPPPLQDVSKLFGELAVVLEATLPQNPEGTVAFRKLLEAKDAAVRAVLFKA